MGTFDVAATIANPTRPERALTLNLLVDTGASWTLLPEEIVRQLELATPFHRTVALASGEQVTYPAGWVTIQLRGEEMFTLFLAGPPGSRPLLGAFTLEGFSLAPDPVKKVLVPVAGLLAACRVLVSRCSRARASGPGFATRRSHRDTVAHEVPTRRLRPARLRLVREAAVPCWPRSP